MGLYKDVFFPWCVDQIMSSATFSTIRNRLLGSVTGNVLEIGFGTGLNLLHYGNHVSQLTTIDVSASMNRKARGRIAESTIKVESLVHNGESLPMTDQSFDCIVSTWTLCSIEQADLALQEIRRLLTPQGRFFFVEHGLSPDPNIQTWQRRLNPLQKWLGCGCRLDRNFTEMFLKHRFCFEQLNQYYMNGAPKTHGYMYEGVAKKG